MCYREYFRDASHITFQMTRSETTVRNRLLPIEKKIESFRTETYITASTLSFNKHRNNF